MILVCFLWIGFRDASFAYHIYNVSKGPYIPRTEQHSLITLTSLHISGFVNIFNTVYLVITCIISLRTSIFTFKIKEII